MNRYKVLLPVSVSPRELKPGEPSYTQGDEFDSDLTAEEETAAVNSGVVEIVPSEWKVVGGSEVHETKPGDTFTKVLTVGEQELLVQGGHIEAVPSKPKSKPKADKEG